MFNNPTTVKHNLEPLALHEIVWARRVPAGLLRLIAVGMLQLSYQSLQRPPCFGIQPQNDQYGTLRSDLRPSVLPYAYAQIYAWSKLLKHVPHSHAVSTHVSVQQHRYRAKSTLNYQPAVIVSIPFYTSSSQFAPVTNSFTRARSAPCTSSTSCVLSTSQHQLSPSAHAHSPRRRTWHAACAALPARQHIPHKMPAPQRAPQVQCPLRR